MEKRAIVIGASSGIGLEVARLLKQRGWRVGVAARRVEQLSEFEVRAQIDVTHEEASTQLLQLVEQLGGMDLYFHASGIGHQNRELKEDIELGTMQTNVMGFTRMVGTAYRYFADHGGGHLAIISSIAGTKGLGPAPAYSASKALQATYIQSLEQLANARGLNIRFTDLRPGFVSTALLNDGNSYPMCLDKTDVAREMVRAIERRQHVRIIDWRWRIVTAAWRCIPRWLWRRLKFLFLISAVLLINSCMQTGNRPDRQTEDASSSLTDSLHTDGLANDSTETTEKTDAAKEQVMALYDLIIKECEHQRQTRDYTNLDDFNSAPYVTAEYLRLHQQVDSMDEANHAEGLRFFNYDHWGLGQEFHSIDSATVSTCTLMDDGRADVTLDLVVRADYLEEPETFHELQRLLLKWEEGQWRVDDFIQDQGPLEKVVSEKKLMKEYLEGTLFQRRN